MVFGFIEDLVSNPVRTVTRAALRLGADVVAGMAMSEIIEALSE